MQPTRLVARGSAAVIKPGAVITIAVDTTYVASQQGRAIRQGIYMIDTGGSRGSTGEGGMELSAVVPVGAAVGFNAVPIDAVSGGKVVINGFNFAAGNVFAPDSYPQPSQLGNEPPGSWWIGRTINAGVQNYQIQIAATAGVIRPVTYYVNWDCFISAQ